MTGAYIPCAYQQGIVHDAPLLLGNGGGGVQSPHTLSSPAFRTPSHPALYSPRFTPPALPLYHLMKKKKQNISPSSIPTTRIPQERPLTDALKKNYCRHYSDSFITEKGK